MLKDLFTPFYEGDGSNAGGGSSSNTNNDNNNQDGNTGDDLNNTDKTIPYSRFKEVNDNYKTVKQQLDELKQQQEKADEDAKKKQGEYETLYNDLKEKHDPLTNEFTQYKETFQDILKNKLESVPKEYQDLIPQGNELEQLKWIENATSKGLFKQDNPSSFGNGGTNPDTSTKTKNKGFLKELSRFK